MDRDNKSCLLTDFKSTDNFFEKNRNPNQEMIFFRISFILLVLSGHNYMIVKSNTQKTKDSLENPAYEVLQNTKDGKNTKFN